MFETVSVDDALHRGIRNIVYPRTSLLILSITSPIFLRAADLIPQSYIFWGIPLGLFVTWFYWAVASTKWKVWAYDSVRNVHELQKRAIKEGIITEEGSFWDSISIKSADDKQKLYELQSKFDVPDVFIDDLQVPAETQIFYSKRKSMFGLMMSLLLILGGTAMMIYTQGYPGVFLIAFGGFLVFKEVQHFTSSQAQVIINAEGIETAKEPFRSWADICDEDVVTEQHGKSTTHNFVYSYDGGSEDINLAPMDITRHAMEHLLLVYRGRSEQKTKH